MSDDAVEPESAPETTPEPATAPQAAPPPEPSAKQPKAPAEVVPLKNFRAVEKDRDTYKEQARQYESELASVRSRVAELESARSEDKALYGAGLVNDEAHVVARALYGGLPEDQRPEGGLAAWVQSFREAPDTAPIGLRAYLTGGSTSAPAAPVKPKVNAGTVPGSDARALGKPLSRQEIKDIHRRALETDDWSEYDARVRPHLNKVTRF